MLITCLADKIKTNEIEALGHGIVAWHKMLDPTGDTICIFNDSAFENDIDKTNLATILKQAGISNINSL